LLALPSPKKDVKDSEDKEPVEELPELEACELMALAVCELDNCWLL